MSRLKLLIEKLRVAVDSGKMTSDFVSKSIAEIKEIGFEYNYDKFPLLVDTESFSDTSLGSPSNLAEALLWKIGKWKTYKKFCNQFADQNSEPSNTDVVFYAFAKHLKDNDNPIYDQHAMRGIWAICSDLDASEVAKCKHLLFDTSNKWKSTGTGANATACYEIFLNRMARIVKDGCTKEELDRLLMPLGQAIKKETNTYVDFENIVKFV